MPKLWSETIESHRREVRETIVDAASRLATERGLLSVTMSRVASEVGIGRATLYKYFPDVESILREWHEQHINRHLVQLTDLASGDAPPMDRLTQVLEAYALICHHRGRHVSPDVSRLLHHSEEVDRAESRLRDVFEGLLDETRSTGEVRSDLSPGELAIYCVHALSGARDLQTEAGVQRLVSVTIAGLSGPVQGD